MSKYEELRKALEAVIGSIQAKIEKNEEDVIENNKQKIFLSTEINNAEENVYMLSSYLNDLRNYDHILNRSKVLASISAIFAFGFSFLVEKLIGLGIFSASIASSLISVVAFEIHYAIQTHEIRAFRKEADVRFLKDELEKAEKQLFEMKKQSVSLEENEKSLADKKKTLECDLQYFNNIFGYLEYGEGLTKDLFLNDEVRINRAFDHDSLAQDVLMRVRTFNKDNK